MDMKLVIQRFGRIATENVGVGMFLGGIGLHRALISRSFRSAPISEKSKYSCDQGNPLPERKKSPIYTRSGDKGTSSLYNGERRSKADPTFDVLGHQDELNAVIGVAREYCSETKNGIEDMLCEIQSRLFDLGAAVATPAQTSPTHKLAYTEVTTTT
jgi:hypothetical protein